MRSTVAPTSPCVPVAVATADTNASTRGRDGSAMTARRASRDGKRLGGGAGGRGDDAREPAGGGAGLGPRGPPGGRGAPAPGGPLGETPPHAARVVQLAQLPVDAGLVRPEVHAHAAVAQ